MKHKDWLTFYTEYTRTNIRDNWNYLLQYITIMHHFRSGGLHIKYTPSPRSNHYWTRGAFWRSPLQGRNKKTTWHLSPVEGVNTEPHIFSGWENWRRRTVPTNLSSWWLSSIILVVGISFTLTVWCDTLFYVSNLLLIPSIIAFRKNLASAWFLQRKGHQWFLKKTG